MRGEDIDFERLIETIEDTGSAVHSVDEIAVGKRLIENTKKTRD